MPKVIFILLLLLLFPTFSHGGELGHVIKDSDMLTGDKWEEATTCIEEEHLFIRLSEKNWNTILGYDKNYKRDVGFSARFCIKCRLIPVSCAGNDWYKYKIKED